jgi:hypothetical protein
VPEPDESCEPGFAEHPGWFATLQEALDRVSADMRATGLPGTARLVVPEWSGRNAFVQTWEGEYGTGGGIFPEAGSNLVAALVAVADDAQDAVMHTIWGTWPVCPEHRFGVHAAERDGAAVWWCEGSSGHVAAEIGSWGRGRGSGRGRAGHAHR